MSQAEIDSVVGGTFSLDLTSTVQATIDKIAATGRSSCLIPAMLRIDGTITLPPGFSLYTRGRASEYYHSSPYAELKAAVFYKPNATSTDGPLVIVKTGCFLSGYFKHLKTAGARTGIIQMGSVGTNEACYNAVLDVCTYGAPEASITFGTMSYGIYFPPSTLTAQRYFNRINAYITNSDGGIRLADQSNGNTFTGYIRQCYIAVDIDGVGGTGESTGNRFSFATANIGVLTGGVPATYVFRIANASWCSFFYESENNGAQSLIDPATTSNLRFFGGANESTSSYIPISREPNSNKDLDFMQPTNRHQYTQLLVPNQATSAGSRYTQGGGSKISMMEYCSGTLPQTNGGAYPQALVAADADSRIICTFNSTVFTKAAMSAFRCKLTVFASAPAGGGTSIATVEFFYRPTNTGTTAGVLNVLSASVKGAAIGGLHFIKSTTTPGAFKIGLVGGGSTATVMNFVSVALDIEALTYDANIVNMFNFNDFSFATAAATANDVTDAITLLTVADTVI